MSHSLNSEAVLKKVIESIILSRWLRGIRGLKILETVCPAALQDILEKCVRKLGAIRQTDVAARFVCGLSRANDELRPTSV
jgi:hypothetical protein